jgi:hypothetical protein
MNPTGSLALFATPGALFLFREQLFALIGLDFTRLARLQQLEDPGVLLGMRLDENSTSSFIRRAIV